MCVDRGYPPAGIRKPEAQTGRRFGAPVRGNPGHMTVRDPKGNPIPGLGSDPAALGPDQVDEALDGLPGWQRQGTSLVRQFAVADDSRGALRDGVRDAAGAGADLTVDHSDGSLRMVLGPGAGDLTVHHLEAAARIDQVLSGAAVDHGST